MPIYALRTSLENLTFRIPSILSIAQVYNFRVEFVDENLDRSVLVVKLKNEADVQRLLERGTLIK